MKEKLNKSQIKTMNITLGSPILERWLRYHFQNHQVTEITIRTNPSDTSMTISLVSEDFPEFDKND